MTPIEIANLALARKHCAAESAHDATPSLGTLSNVPTAMHLGRWLELDGRQLQIPA